MSGDEEAELREMVLQTLQNNGVLAKIKAELRANVFLALQEDGDKPVIKPNEVLTALTNIQEGKLILNLIREFLEFYELDYTLSVFNLETRFETDYQHVSRENIAKELSLKSEHDNSNSPLLLSIVSRLCSKDTVPLESLEVKDLRKDNEDILKCNRPGFDNLNNKWSNMSPLNLNSTYIKSREDDSPKLSVSQKVAEDSFASCEPSSPPEDLHETFKSTKTDDGNFKSVCEDKTPNLSDDSCSSAQTTPRKEPPKSSGDPLSPFLLTSTPNDLLMNTPKKNKNEEVDLLTFTPAKKENKSILGDLPPLTLKSVPSKSSAQIDQIKAIMDQGIDVEEDSISSKGSNGVREDEVLEKTESGKSSKSDVTEELDEDVNDLLASHRTESQSTLDETISTVSGVGDYLESV